MRGESRCDVTSTERLQELDDCLHLVISERRGHEGLLLHGRLGNTTRLCSADE